MKVIRFDSENKSKGKEKYEDAVKVIEWLDGNVSDMEALLGELKERMEEYGEVLEDMRWFVEKLKEHGGGP